VGHEQKADLVWTKEEFLELCEHMLNGNPSNHFLMAYRDRTSGKAKFAKAKVCQMSDRAKWAWDSVIGRAKSPFGIGFYPSSENRRSRWAAMDFDAHDGGGERARDLALKAFHLLYRQPQLFVVLATSGSEGWHLFAFSRELHPVDEWARLLKQVVNWIGSEIRPGLCEIFPGGANGGIGYGIRAPGTWNPKYGTFGLIAFENVKSLLCQRERRERVNPFLARETHSGSSDEFPDRRKVDTFRGNWDEWRGDFAITLPRTRHAQLKALVLHTFRQVGREVARMNAGAQYAEAKASMEANATEHVAEFAELWKWAAEKWSCELSERERKFHDALSTENERDAFRIVRNFARLADMNGHPDFPFVRESVAHRLGVTGPGAAKIRDKLVRLGALTLTAHYVPNKSANRYRWVLDASEEEPF